MPFRFHKAAGHPAALPHVFCPNSLMKYRFLLFATLLFGSAQAQSKAVDDAARRPDRPKQSGKADVYVQDKKRISDDSSTKAAPRQPARKKKSCGKGSQ